MVKLACSIATQLKCIFAFIQNKFFLKTSPYFVPIKVEIFVKSKGTWKDKTLSFIVTLDLLLVNIILDSMDCYLRRETKGLGHP